MLDVYAMLQALRDGDTGQPGSASLARMQAETNLAVSGASRKLIKAPLFLNESMDPALSDCEGGSFIDNLHLDELDVADGEVHSSTHLCEVVRRVYSIDCH